MSFASRTLAALLLLGVAQAAATPMDTVEAELRRGYMAQFNLVAGLCGASLPKLRSLPGVRSCQIAFRGDVVTVTLRLTNGKQATRQINLAQSAEHIGLSVDAERYLKMTMQDLNEKPEQQASLLAGQSCERVTTLTPPSPLLTCTVGIEETGLKVISVTQAGQVYEVRRDLNLNTSPYGLPPAAIAYAGKVQAKVLQGAGSRGQPCIALVKLPLPQALRGCDLVTDPNGYAVHLETRQGAHFYLSAGDGLSTNVP